MKSKSSLKVPPALRLAAPPGPVAMAYWPIRMDAAMLKSIAVRAQGLHASKSATARAAIKRGLALITPADVLKESF